MILGRPGLTLLASATISRLADAAASIALVLLIIARTHDPRLAGLVVAAFTVPTLVTGPVLGAFLDRLRHRRPLFAANQVMLAAALTATGLLAGHVPGELLAGFGLCAGLTAPVLTGGFSSLVPLVVRPTVLGRANALDSASYNVAGLAGPALVAAIAGLAGAGIALAAVAALAAAGLLLVGIAPMPAATAPPQRESLPAAVADGLRLLRESPPLRSVTIATTAGMFFQGLMPVTFPLLAVALGNAASGGGWLLAALSAGALAGSLLSERLLSLWSPRVVLIGSFGGFGLLLALIAVTPAFWLSLVLAAAAGAAEGPSLAATLTVRQQAVPPARYAQAVATAASIKTGAYALGAAVTGVLAGVLTARELVVGIAAGQLLAALPLLLAYGAFPEMPNERVVPAQRSAY
jgi:MFS family permease